LSSVLPAILIAALGLPSHQPAPSLTPQSMPPAKALAAPAPEVSVPPGAGKVPWASSADLAQDRAAREEKFVFFEFTKEECGNCQRMDSLLYPAADFGALLASMVPVKLELVSSEGKEIAQKYHIDDAPAILITTANGRLVFLMQGFLNQGDFFRHVNADLEKYREFARRVDSQSIAKLSAKEALETGNELYQRLDPQSALSRLKRVLAAPDATVKQREDALELKAAVELELSVPSASRSTIEQLLATTKDRQRRERAELFRAQIPLAENRPAEALALFRKFQTDHPTSPHIERVKELVQQLEERTSKP
jgi:thioredoxin-related protein